MKNRNYLTLSSQGKASLLLALASVFVFSQSAFAASACKEMEKEACLSSTSCSWIDSYTTKKGNTVKAYCRNKPKQKSGKLESDTNKQAQAGKRG